MAILSKEDLLAKYSAVIGENNSDEALALLEDMSDTIDSMAEKIGEDWKSKFEENDKAWRERYKARFFDAPAQSEEPIEDVEDGEAPAPTKYEELFEREEK